MDMLVASILKDNQTMMKQQLTWQAIIDKIQEQMGAKSEQDWKENNYALVKAFGNRLTEKLIGLVAKNKDLAKHLKDETDYQNKSEQEIAAFIKKTTKVLDKYQIGEITLRGYFTGNKTTPHQDKCNALSLFAFEKPFYELITQTEYDTVQTKHLKITQFYNTHWWLYFYDYDDNKRMGRLGRAVLAIGENDQAEIQNVESETATHYKGKVEVDNTNQHLFFDFTSDLANEKHLRISVFVGNGKCYPLAVGTYMNITAQNTMPAGIVVIEQVIEPDKIAEMKPMLIEFDQATQFGVHESIITFLQEREKNYIKAPQGILAIKQLDRWLADKKTLHNATKQ